MWLRGLRWELTAGKAANDGRSVRQTRMSTNQPVIMPRPACNFHMVERVPPLTTSQNSKKCYNRS